MGQGYIYHFLNTAVVAVVGGELKKAGIAFEHNEKREHIQQVTGMEKRLPWKRFRRFLFRCLPCSIQNHVCWWRILQTANDTSYLNE